MRKKLIDLHTHTCYSDGEYTSEELLVLAKNKGVGTIAITDHDTIEGLKGIDRSKDYELNIVDGIELSASVDKGTMHILGYGIDINDQALNNSLEKVKERNVLKIISLIEQLYLDFRIKFRDSDVEEMFKNNYNVKRPHVAQLCMKYGYASSIQEAFSKYLIYSYDKIDRKKYGLTYDECISLINNSGGVAVLAHPNSLLLDYASLCIKLEELIGLGLRGIEAYHSSFSKEERDLYLGLAEYYHLLISGGTDYHGPLIKPHIEIGLGCDDNVNLTDIPIMKVLR